MVLSIAKLVIGVLPIFGVLTQGRTTGDPDFPTTGVKTRRYNFEIARAKLAPDGYQKDMIVVNGQFPAPLIEANWGDWVEVTVKNSIQNPPEGTAIHWHALDQKETPWYDGVPGVSQCPIAPGATFTYRFRADHVGTTFYHSHYSAQISAGISGPMVFYGPKSQPYDHDLGPVFLTDWFHTRYETLVQGIVGNGTNKKPAFSDNNLINGKMNFDCGKVTDGTPCVNNAGLSKFKFEEGKDHLLRVINGGSAGLQYFTVDEHDLTVISMDFIPIKPYKTNYITLGVGQRSDVIVRGKKGLDAQRPYYMRNNLSTICALPRQPHGLATIYYQDSDSKKISSSQAQNFTEDRLKCSNEPLDTTTPLVAIPAKTPDKTVTIQILDTLNATGHENYLMNNQTFRVNFNQPILRLANQGNFNFNPELNVYSTGTSSVVRVVWENQKFDPSQPGFNNLTFAHPMHMHGHDFQVLSSGTGTWDGTIVNADNPLRRDTHVMPPNGHLVVQFETNNPGVWPFHCHVAWHASAGFLVNFLERPLDLPKRKEIPQVMKETCTAWDAYSSTSVVNQIDSGLKDRLKERS